METDRAMTEEQWLRYELSELERAYRKMAEPFVRRLVMIEMVKSPQIIVPIADLPESLKV